MNTELWELMGKKEAMEKEFESLSQKLETFKSKNLHKDLVDQEGFPRADLDFGELVAYKETKKRMAEL